MTSRPIPGRSLALLVFAQMLPAMLVVPAIRPLFAAYHGNAESPMHLFMSVNMIGAVIAAPVLGLLLDRTSRRGAMLAWLAAADAVLLVACSAPAPTLVVLGLRFVEGAAHVGALTVLMAEAAALGRRENDPRTIALAGTGIVMAIAGGMPLGGVLLAFDVRAPFWGAALIAALVAIYGPRRLTASPLPERPHLREVVAIARVLWAPATAAFAARFTVGCVVVTFSLFAANVHGLTTNSISALLSALTVPFALATYPASRLPLPRSLVLGGGMLAYAIGLAAVPVAPIELLSPIMIVAGVASGAIFMSTLGYAADLGAAARGSAMALFNAAGCLGMVLGPMVAGITIAVLRASHGAATGYRVVFVIASSSLVLWLIAAAGWLRQRARDEGGARVSTSPPGSFS
jgi:MFS family permease